VKDKQRYPITPKNKKLLTPEAFDFAVDCNLFFLIFRNRIIYLKRALP